MTLPDGRSSGGALAVLLISGVLGFYLGYARFPHWQVPVETAQVLAGVVRYPEETPFFIYHVKLWTVLHQLCAILLRAGASEIKLSYVLSGLLGMLSLQALATVAFAFSRSLIAALAAAFVIFVSQVSDAGVVYPIFLVGVPFTYGIVGLSLVVVIAGALGSGLTRTAALLLGVLPCVHPSLGIWFWIIVVLAALVDRRLRERLLAAWRWLGVGLGMTVLSFAIHQWMSHGVPSVPVEAGRTYFDGFVSFWDGHRRPIRLGEIGVILNVVGLVFSTIWLATEKRKATGNTVDTENATLDERRRGPTTISVLAVVRILQVSTALALLLVPLSWMPPQSLPTTVLILMPGRILNVGSMLLAPVVLGAMAGGRSRNQAWLLSATMIALLLSNHSLLWHLAPRSQPPWTSGLSSQWVVILATLATLLIAAVPRSRAPANATIARTIVVAAGIVGAFVAFKTPEHRENIFFDRTNDSVLASAAHGEGLLLTAGDMPLIQLRTRRPLLIDTGALDTAAYSPATAPALARILKDIYGVDFFHPPEEARGAGSLPPSAHRQQWERARGDAWKKIRRDWHVTQVLTPYDWQLDLPIVAGNRRFLLYAIPE